MHEECPVANFLNGYVFDPLARTLGVNLTPDHHAVPDHIIMILIVAIGLLTFGLWLRRQLSVDNPTRTQHLIELVFEGVRNLMKEVIGRESNRFTPIIGTLGAYILVGNLLGLVPGFISPTSNLNITASCAICVFFYYNYQGVRKHGFRKYMKHFAGPVVWLAPLLFTIEIISHLARPFSLSVRLFGNIFAEELIIGSLNTYIFPFLISIPVMFLALFASTIQAFIFILLTMVYISGAVEEGHEESGAETHGETPAHYGKTQTAAV